MESIPELRKMLQTNVQGHPILMRVLSIYVTRLILPTSITANQVTVAMLLVGIISAIPFYFGYLWLGLALSYLGIVLDGVDGEVARYRKTHSLKGIYLDLVQHLAIQAWFFLALGFAVAQTHTGILADGILLAAAIGALSFMLRIANGMLHREIYVHHYNSHRDRFSLPHVPSGNIEFEEQSDGGTIISRIKHAVYSSEHHAIMIVVFAFVLLVEMFVSPGYGQYTILPWLIIAYTAVSVLYLFKEIISSYHAMERRVAAVQTRLEQE